MKKQETDVLNFVTAAREYCSWCEVFESKLTDARAAYLLARLYSLALLLPNIETDNGKQLPELSAQQLVAATRGLSTFAGRYYRVVFDPDPLISDEPCIGDLEDDLLDIYKDVSASLILYDLGETNEAIWHWSFLHRVHWGRHASSAVHALHCMTISQSD